MADQLVGYDMLVAITENEVNSQFERLYETKIIDQAVQGNGVSSDSGPFGGGEMTLSSYIRAPITAPKVRFGSSDHPHQVQFYFSFDKAEVTAEDLGVSAADLKQAFANSPDGTNGVLVKKEDIPYRDSKGNTKTLKDQEVRYWLTQEKTKVGTSEVVHYFHQPAIFYQENNHHMMVKLSELQLSFEVLLNHIPTTADELEKRVKENLVSPDLLEAIHNGHFNDQVFSLQQLFLDFDSVDFTQWNLKDPAGKLGGEVTGMAIKEDGTFSVRTIALSKLLDQDPQFSTVLSSNLQYVFGVHDKNEAGRTPLIIGLGVSSTNPSTSNPNEPPSLVPTYIGYSTTPNPKDQGLATINYQVLGGKDPKSRIPKNNDGSVKNVSTNFVTNNAYSGELVFDRSVYFEPHVLSTIQGALRPGLDWKNEGHRWNAEYSNRRRVYHNKDTWLGTGFIENVFFEDNNAYTIEVDKDTVTVSGVLKREVKIQIIEEVFTGKIYYDWWKTATVNWTSTYKMYVDPNGRLSFNHSSDFPSAKISPLHRDLGGKIVGFVSNVLSTLSGKYFKPIGSTMNDAAQQIAQNLTDQEHRINRHMIAGIEHNFISPTGKVFLMHGPRFNEELDLQMDVTYSV